MSQDGNACEGEREHPFQTPAGRLLWFCDLLERAGWVNYPRHGAEGLAADIRAALSAPTPLGGWQPIETLKVDPDKTTYVNVRSVTTYRWLPYKADGRRQMNSPGRWQMAVNEYGKWTNATLPVRGEWGHP